MGLNLLSHSPITTATSHRSRALFPSARSAAGRRETDRQQHPRSHQNWRVELILYLCCVRRGQSFLYPFSPSHFATGCPRGAKAPKDWGRMRDSSTRNLACLCPSSGRRCAAWLRQDAHLLLVLRKASLGEGKKIGSGVGESNRNRLSSGNYICAVCAVIEPFSLPPALQRGEGGRRPDEGQMQARFLPLLPLIRASPAFSP